MASDDKQTLPSKEQNLFRQIVKYYETKQYKKGLKAADQVLKKHPEHGETLAMKGLTLNCLERKEEAYDLVRKGLKANLRSHVCWHVYGLLYRSDRNYAEAIKCYINALRMDKDNLQILRDLALLQVQMRDAKGFIDTRQKLLQQKPNNRNNWITFAVAHHLNKNYDVAVQVLESYQNTVDEVPLSEAYEHSEMLLYKASILEEAGKLEEALKVLDTHSSSGEIKDILSFKEQRARILLALGMMSGAHEAYRGLLALNPDNTKYHDAMLKSVGLVCKEGGAWSPEDLGKLSALYAELQESFPKSLACKRVPLDFKVGDEFSSAAAKYVTRFLARGIPSLFSDLKGLYADNAKAAALQKLFEDLETKLAAGAEDIPGLTPSDCSTSDDNPPPLVWVQLYLAQHHDRLKDTSKALEYVEKVIAADPKLIDGFSVKSKILKHAGDLHGAANVADQARKMDLADRFLNSTCAKAMFRAGRIEDAEATAALFTKDNDQVTSLYDMQCMWYEIECGRAHSARKNRGKALKNFTAATKHFDDFIEDQFDFHSYCIRKMTLRAYIDLLNLEDRIMSNPFFAHSAIGAVREYLELHDNPSSKDADKKDEEALMAAMDPAERKRYKAKKRKEEARRKKEEEEAAAAAAAAAAAKEKADNKGKKGGAAQKEKDPDPDGAQLAATEDPLGEAAKLVTQLKEHCSNDIAAHQAAFDLYLRKGRMMLALQATLKARSIAGPNSPEGFRLTVRMVDAFQKIPAQGSEGALNSVVHSVLEDEVKKILGGKTLATFVSSWVEEFGRSGSLPALMASAEMTALVSPDKVGDAAKMLLGCKVGPESSHAEFVECHKLLTGPLGATEAGEAFKRLAQERFNYSTYFEGSKRGLPPATADGVADGVKGVKL